MRILPGIILLLSQVLLAQEPAKPAANAAADLSPPQLPNVRNRPALLKCGK